jgi:HEPN domain-containing protein
LNLGQGSGLGVAPSRILPGSPTLTRLWSVLPEQDWRPEPPDALEDRLRLLDGFYIPTRYPDSYPEGTPGEHFGRLQSEQALVHARAITEWIRAALASRR